MMCFNDMQAAWNKEWEALARDWLELGGYKQPHAHSSSGMMPLRQQASLHKSPDFAESGSEPFGREHLCVWYSCSDTQMQASFILPAEEHPVLTVQTKAGHHPCQCLVGKILPGKEEAPFPSEAFSQSLTFQRKPVKRDCWSPGYSSSTGPGDRLSCSSRTEEKSQQEHCQSAETNSFAMTYHILKKGDVAAGNNNRPWRLEAVRRNRWSPAWPRAVPSLPPPVSGSSPDCIPPCPWSQAASWVSLCISGSAQGCIHSGTGSQT